LHNRDDGDDDHVTVISVFWPIATVAFYALQVVGILG
jgi:hypothetical protein